MNEFIDIEFRKPNGRRLRVRRQVAGGIEFDEPDPIERTVGFQMTGRSEATRFRIRRIARVKGWDPGQFKLAVSVEDGNVVLRGVDADALPEGNYALRLQIEEAEARQQTTSVDVRHDGHGELTVEVRQDDRTIDVDLVDCNPDIERVLDASTIDGAAAPDWLEDDWRPTRKACLLNLLASLRVSPTKTNNLLGYVHEVVRVFNDRVYMRVDSALGARVEELVSDANRPYYAEGSPAASIHRRLLDAIPADEKPGFDALRSYRGEGRPSLQMVIAVPPVGLSYTYADFDLDLGNPLQDVLGFVTHMGELFSGNPTNHLDLRKKLAKGKAGEFLYYTIA